MPEHNGYLLVKILRNSDLANQLDLEQWDLVIRQARRADLLPQLYYDLNKKGILKALPQEVFCHLESAYHLSVAHQQAVRWEVNRIQSALRKLEVPVTLLKGAAYVLADLPCARGRLFSDVDILLPKMVLDEAEQSLMAHGWMSVDTDPYDQRYYRQWMHELPPLRHVKRQTSLDVHHSILPETARWHPNAKKLLQAAKSVEGYEELYVLSPVDMVLHSATHLFSEGEIDHGLRDLFDLDALLRYFGEQKDFWDLLYARAKTMDLTRPLYYALRYTQYFLGTPITESSCNKKIGQPTWALRYLMDMLFQRGLSPDHPSCNDSFTGFARWLLYLRGHYLRMPLYLLLPHLVRKSIRRNE